MTKKSSFIAVCGAPNAGKSTLINKIVGAKVSIVSPRPQTTRENIKGIANIGDTQLVFIDTPGIMKADGERLRGMVNQAWQGIGEGEQILFVIDAFKGINDWVQNLLEGFKNKGIKAIAVINKVDLVSQPQLFELAQALFDTGIFTEVFMVSCKKNLAVDDVVAHLAKNAVAVEEWFFPEDQLSDKNDRFLAAETTREKMFYLLQQEVPYGVDVETDSFVESDKAITIHQTIFVPRESHKTIVIGNKGAMLKEIGTKSRLDLQRLLDKKVNLFLHVKVRISDSK
jgi:GTP-binding protein Era